MLKSVRQLDVERAEAELTWLMLTEDAIKRRQEAGREACRAHTPADLRMQLVGMTGIWDDRRRPRRPDPPACDTAVSRCSPSR